MLKKFVYNLNANKTLSYSKNCTYVLASKTTGILIILITYTILDLHVKVVQFHYKKVLFMLSWDWAFLFCWQFARS